MGTAKTILVSGMIAGDPWQGGATWAVLQYVLGFARLGHRVYFVEPLQTRRSGTEGARTESARYFADVMAEFGLGQKSALIIAGTEKTVGLTYDDLQRVCHGVDLLVNISGLLSDEKLTSKIPVRVYLDLDPAFNQLWQAVQGIDMRFSGHTHYVTIGRNIGAPECPVPTCGLQWLHTFQPVVLEHWPAADRINYDALTTVGNWRGYGSIEYNGVFYGQKAHSLRRLMALPTLTTMKFMPALAIHPDEKKDLAAMAANGWELLDPAQVANTPGRYRDFIQKSRGELGIAKKGYVVSRCGWFSDRSVCYLASGRPVLAQDTGLSGHLPVGEGLFLFREQQDVLSAIEDLRYNYARHSRQARAIARQYFDSDLVLRRFTEMVGL